MQNVLKSVADNYADDTTMTATAKTGVEIGIKLISDCSKVSDWMRSNKLKLNPDKLPSWHWALQRGWESYCLCLRDRVRTMLNTTII